MIALVALTLAIQGPARPPRRTVVRDSVNDTTAAPDTTARGRRRRAGVRQPVTAEVLATAFKDPAARVLLYRARSARLTQDSALSSYDATAYQKLFVSMGITSVGRQHPMYIAESATHVQWKRGVGAWVDMRGARTAIPMASEADNDESLRGSVNGTQMSPIPYYPGYEPLWFPGPSTQTQVDEGSLVHPIAAGAEAYYTYESGDSLTYTLPDGRRTMLRELLVRPRTPHWNLAVGSLWFEVSSGQLVRAVYRLSIPADFLLVAKEEQKLNKEQPQPDTTKEEDMPALAKALITPLVGQLNAVEIEYGLYESRFWLPRLRSATGTVQVSFLHVPFTQQQTFRYAGVNTLDSLPRIFVSNTAPAPAAQVTVSIGSGRPDTSQKARRARRDSARADRDARHKTECDARGYYVEARYRYTDSLPVAVKIPCDLKALANSPDLPPSIYTTPDTLFPSQLADAFLAKALSLGAQPPLSLGSLPVPTLAYGLQLTRYNRIEGFSTGIRADEQLGGGYSSQLTLRLGAADLQPNAELTVSRSNLAKTVSIGGYNRLVSASDWGRPLSFSSSVSALLFGRDEGFYYRASGAELGGTSESLFGGTTHVQWRAFVEEQRTADQRTTYALHGTFPANILARRGAYGGSSVRLTNSRGLDPNGFRLLSDLRAEAGLGGGSADSVYGRGAFDVTLSRGLGPVAAALTASAGASAGALPPQRRWFLGGSQTIRGQSPDTAQSGNAFWMGRAELGTNSTGMRNIVFGDFGWVGDRTAVTKLVRPMSGVGTGVSFLDGLFRLDVARGIFPRKQWRTDFYLEARF